MLRLFRQYYPVRNIFFVLGEGFFIFFSVLIACGIFQGSDVGQGVAFYLRIFLITATCLMCLYYNDLYDFQVVDNFSELGIRLLQALGAAAIFLAVVYYLFPEATVGSNIFVVSIILVILFIIAWRFGYTIVLNRGVFDEKIIVLGAGDLASNILREIRDKRDCGYRATVIVPAGEADIAPLRSYSERVVVRQEGVDLCDMAEALGKACPNGIDIYFDNVGGEILDAALRYLNRGGRIPLCGAISQYNATEPVPGPHNYLSLLINRGRMEGFIVFDFRKRYGEALEKLGQWVQEGKIHARYDVVDGLENAPRALLKLFDGENTGKLMVKIAEESA